MSRPSSTPRRAAVLVATLSTLLVGQIVPSAGADRSVAVGQGGDRFTPATVEIVAGDSVVWKNHGGWHNVHGDGFSNAVSDSSWTFRHTFTSEGTFGYVCDVHPNMRGTVVVSAAPAPPPAETEPPAPEPTLAPEPEPEPSSEPPAPEPTTAAPRPRSTTTAPAEPDPTTGDDATSGPESPQPTPEPTGGTAGTDPAAPPSPEITPSETPRPSASPRIAAPASDVGGGGGAVAVAVGAALLLAAAGGVWAARSRRP